MSSLSIFSEFTRAWFDSTFEAPTPAQDGAWRAIGAGADALVVAPTGSGKTLAAFLWSIDMLINSEAPPPKERLRVLYISPLKALAADIERNLRSPLVGITNAAARSGASVREIIVGVRTGDTPPDVRRRLSSHPPDILITTPESLFLILTSQARESLRHVDTVIIDEIHSVAGNKRGSHLALSLERLDVLLARPARRIGLSATVRPVDEVARFLGGGRQVQVVAPAFHKSFDLKVIVPVPDLADIDDPRADEAPERKTIWPAIEENIVDLIKSHNSTIVFANSRRLSERLCARINEIAGIELARAHHGSVSRERRTAIEEDLKLGRLSAVVATSSLELGIDMGAVDLVIQIEAPTSVASGLQRIGRAGHQVGAVSRGIIFPKWRGDLIECAVVAERMRAGQIEELAILRNPLDVLAQQLVAMIAMDPWTVEGIAETVRRASSFSTLPDSALREVLDMLSGRYPSDAFAELRPRISWDRGTSELTPRPGAQRLAVTNGGTIPDRGMYGVFLASEKPTRVGELDEEMVYEARVGEVFVLGSSHWLIQEITADRVMVTPAPGRPAKMPFWKADSIGRPAELGRALGGFMREVGSMADEPAIERLAAAGLDRRAASNLLAYLQEQRDATGSLPSDRTIVIERFKDEIGDWRLCIHSPFGARVNAPWSLAIKAGIVERLEMDAPTMYSDDGIVVRLPEADEAPTASSIFIDPDEVEQLVTAAVGGSALFSSRFRECAARALLIPRRAPGRRTPLWQQRQRSADLLKVASSYGSFPIILETMRECLQDVFDVPGLTRIMRDIQSGAMKVVEVDTVKASPFAGSLLFGYVGAFLYDSDLPLAERRAQVLSLDSALLAELMGSSEMKDLIEPEVLDEVESELRRSHPASRLRGPDDLHDLLRVLGELRQDEIEQRGGSAKWLEELRSHNRIIPIRIASTDYWCAVEDAARFRDGLGVALPPGLPVSLLVPVPDALSGLLSRWARVHGPFMASDIATRFALDERVVTHHLLDLQRGGQVRRGSFSSRDEGDEWCDVDVMRAIRRRSLAKLRSEVEPVPQDVLTRAMLERHEIGSGRGTTALMGAIGLLQGYPLPARELERIILPSRVTDYSPSMLDPLLASGEVVWVGRGAAGAKDGWVSLYLIDDLEIMLPVPNEEISSGSRKVVNALSDAGALFFRQLAEVTGASDQELTGWLWEAAWAGWITNDSMLPLRAMTSGLATNRSSTRVVSRPGAVRKRRLVMPTVGGRWSLLPTPGAPEAALLATALQMLDRHGVLTRGAVVSEKPLGGFSAVYRLLRTFEEAGKCRRGYFVEGLGAAQFALPGAVDSMRSRPQTETSGALVLAATDPANPYGAALDWPDNGSAHRPGRKVGACVVLVDSQLAAFVEKGGRSVLLFTQDSQVLEESAGALASAVRRGWVGPASVERVDGVDVDSSPLAEFLMAAGFKQTSRGLRLRR